MKIALIALALIAAPASAQSFHNTPEENEAYCASPERAKHLYCQARSWPRTTHKFAGSTDYWLPSSEDPFCRKGKEIVDCPVELTPSEFGKKLTDCMLGDGVACRTKPVVKVRPPGDATRSAWQQVCLGVIDSNDIEKCGPDVDKVPAKICAPWVRRDSRWQRECLVATYEKETENRYDWQTGHAH